MVFMQEGKPIAYASMSLTPSECDYAQIEKELFAIVFGCKRFHHYIYVCKFTVQSDHKLLIPIFCCMFIFGFLLRLYMI